MICEPVSEKKLAEWRETYEQFKGRLKPNKKASKEVVNYLKNKYNVEQLFDEKHLMLVYESVVNNAFFRKKLLPGQVPTPVFFLVKNDNASKFLYENQENFWDNCAILVGIDLVTGYLYVEGSCLLYDELYAFQGLDELDLENFVRVADYVECIKKFDKSYYNAVK